MLIIVNHDITHPQEFWGAAQVELPNLPEGIKLHMSAPNAEGNRATCLWEAESVEVLTTYLERVTGAFCNNAYMAVEAKNGMGLPG